MLESSSGSRGPPNGAIGEKSVPVRVSTVYPPQEDLHVLHAGMEQCPPAHAFGPAVRDYYLIHFILKGKGRFQAENRTHQLAAGEGFLICPDQVTFYEADAQDPWFYVWIAFSGQAADITLRQAGLCNTSPILHTPPCLQDRHDDGSLKPIWCFEQIAAALELRQGRDLRLLALLQLLLSHLIEQNPNPPVAEDQINRRDWYVRQAQDYLEVNYARKIAITDLARHLGLDRSYFGQLFRHATGLSPQRYLLELRMAKACSLMTHTRLPVAAVARSVGYDDPLLFSRMFHRIKSCSPSDYCRRQASLQTLNQTMRQT